MKSVTKPTRTPGVQYERYFCTSLDKHGPDYCDQPPMERRLIDEAVTNFFLTVAVDLDATRAVINDAHTVKVNELAALCSQAERDVQQAEARLVRVRTDYTDGKIDADDWRSFRDELTTGLEAAHAQVERLEAQRQAVDLEIAQLDSETSVLAEIAALRTTIVGEARQGSEKGVAGSEKGVAAFRAALRRTFQPFTLCVIRTHPNGRREVVRNPYERREYIAASGWSGFLHESLMLDPINHANGASTAYVLEPKIRSDALPTTPSAEGPFPALERVALMLSESEDKTLTT
jgi:hypothetical protein